MLLTSLHLKEHLSKIPLPLKKQPLIFIMLVLAFWSTHPYSSLSAEIIPGEAAKSPLSQTADGGEPPFQADQEISGEVQELIASSPTAENLPDDAVIILLKEEHHFVNADGTATVHVHELAKILRESGKSLAQVSLPYNSSKETFEIEIARTIKSNGSMIPVDPALIQDLAVLGDTPLFSDVRLRQLVYPNVSIGDFLELKYVIRIKEPIVAGVYTTYFTYPLGLMTKRSRLSISIPSELTPHFAVTLPSGQEPQITDKGGRRIYQWAPDPIVLSRGHEPAIPPSFDVDPYVFFSTMKSWDILTQWYVPLFEATLEKTSQEIKEKAQFYKYEYHGEREKIIQTLFEYVSQEVEYVGVTLGESAWKPYPPSYVMTHRYGDCKGKSGLLIALLREAGIEAYGALVKPSDQGRLLLNIPSLDFTHMIVALPENDGSYRYLDPTLPMVPYNYLIPYEENRDVIILDKSEPHFEKTPVLPVEQSNQSYSTESVTIQEDGTAKFKGVLQWTGLNAMDHRLMVRNTNPAILQDLLQRSLREQYPQSQLESYALHNSTNVNEPFEMTIDATIVGMTQIADSLLLVEQTSVLDPALASLVTFDERIYPIFLGLKEVKIWEGTLVPPEGYSPKTIPANVSLTDSFGTYERRYEADGNRLKGYVKLVLDQPVIPVDIYTLFKSFVEKIAGYEKEKIIFEKLKATPAASNQPTL